MTPEFRFDADRRRRIGIDEAVLCESKTAAQIELALADADRRDASLLLTRLGPEQFAALSPARRSQLDYCGVSRTAVYGALSEAKHRTNVAIVTAGASDLRVAVEAQRTLRYGGVEALLIADVGVAGLWRLADAFPVIARRPILIVVAGMDAALASVLGGLVGGVLICVPTSVGYGVAANGHAALNAILASCAPGLLVCNIDNGYGAACAALRMIRALRVHDEADFPADAGLSFEAALRAPNLRS